jgi:hypothetical protein
MSFAPALPAKAGFDRSVPRVELEVPLWFYFLSCLLRGLPRQRFQLIGAALY